MNTYEVWLFVEGELVKQVVDNCADPVDAGHEAYKLVEPNQSVEVVDWLTVPLWPSVQDATK